jgi:hypothetical protein
MKKGWVILLSCIALFIFSNGNQSKKIEIEWDKSIDPIIEKALKAIKAAQKKNGAIGDDYLVAGTSLSGLALLAAGYQAGRGKYGYVVRRAIDYLLSVGRRNQNGYITDEGARSQIHGHGFALTFLSYAYGDACTFLKRELDCDIYKKIIKKAIKFAEQFQGANGGWGYQPGDSMEENSVTVCAVMSLRAAKEAGFRVDPKVIKKGAKYIEDCANADGSFAYNLGQRHGNRASNRSGNCRFIFLWKTFTIFA